MPSPGLPIKRACKYMAFPMRWLLQRNRFSCLPIALMNLQIWLDHPVSYKRDYPVWRDRCGCSRKRSGRYSTSFGNVWDHIRGINHVKYVRPSLGQIKKAVKRGVVIMNSIINIDDGHAFLIPEVDAYGLFCVNVCGQHLWLSDFEFVRHFLREEIVEGCEYPSAFFIKRSKHVRQDRSE